MAWLITDARVFGGKTTAPGATDDENSGYRIGDFWIDETSDASYQLVDKTAGAAIWIVTSPELHAPLHRASEADDLLSAPGAIGGGTPAAGAFTTLSASGLISADGGRIAFPITQNASADVNTLDDYEEGAWTPTLTTTGVDFDSVTYDAATEGRYTKIGRVVTIHGQVRTDAITKGGATGNVIIGGLPFTSSFAGNIAMSSAQNFLDDFPHTGKINASAAFISLYYRVAINTADVLLQISDIGTGANNNRVIFTGQYIV